MTEIVYHPEARCVVSAGIRPDDVSVELTDVDGRRQYIHIDKSMINDDSGGQYLPIGIVEIDRRRRRVLIELPVEADSGANRMWVHFADLRTGANRDAEIVA